MSRMSSMQNLTLEFAALCKQYKRIWYSVAGEFFY